MGLAVGRMKRIMAVLLSHHHKLFKGRISVLLTDLGRMSPPGHVLGPDGLLDAVHLLLVALAVTSSVLLGLLQSRLQGLDPLSRSTKTLFQFRKLTAQVCIITYQLWERSGHFHLFQFSQA